jgi:predicted nuclease with TOPRIM domain
MTNKGPTVRDLEKQLGDLAHKIQMQAEQSDQKLNEFRNELATVNERAQTLEKDVPLKIHELKVETQKDSQQIGQDLQSQINELTLEIQKQCQQLGQSVQSEINLLKLQILAQAQESQQKLNGIEIDLAEFKGSVNTSLSLAKWIGSFAAVVIVSLIGFGWHFSGTNGRLEQNVSGLGERMKKLEERVEKLDERIKGIQPGVKAP